MVNVNPKENDGSGGESPRMSSFTVVGSTDDETEDAAFDTSAIQLDNLDPSITKEEIIDKFQEYGIIAQPGVVIKRKTAEAFVNFNSHSVVQKILNYKNTIIIRGIKLTVRAGSWKFFDLDTVEQEKKLEMTTKAKEVDSKDTISICSIASDDSDEQRLSQAEHEDEVCIQISLQEASFKENAVENISDLRRSQFENSRSSPIRSTNSPNLQKKKTNKSNPDAVKQLCEEVSSSVISKHLGDPSQTECDDQNGRDDRVRQKYSSSVDRNGGIARKEKNGKIRIEKSEVRVKRSSVGDSGNKCERHNQTKHIRVNEGNDKKKIMKSTARSSNRSKKATLESETRTSSSADKDFSRKSRDYDRNSKCQRGKIEPKKNKTPVKSKKAESHSKSSNNESDLNAKVCHGAQSKRNSRRQIGPISDEASCDSLSDESEESDSDLKNSRKAEQSKSAKGRSRYERYSSESESESIESDSTKIDDDDSDMPSNHHYHSDDRQYIGIKHSAVYQDKTSDTVQRNRKISDNSMKPFDVVRKPSDHRAHREKPSRNEVESNDYLRRSNRETQKGKFVSSYQSQPENRSRQHVASNNQDEEIYDGKQPVIDPTVKSFHSTRIQIRNISKLSSKDILLLYFKNEHRSLGGTIVDCSFNPDFDYAVIAFESEAVTERVLSKKGGHLLEGQTLYVSTLPPICERRFYFENIPAEITRDTLETYLEARGLCMVDRIQFREDNKGAIVSFQNDVFDLQRKLNSRPLKYEDGRQMTDVIVHQIVHPDAVLVCGKITNDDLLIYPIENYLSENAKLVCNKVRLVFPQYETDMALVVFEDYKAVLYFRDTITIGENMLTISPFFDHLGWVPQNTKPYYKREFITNKVTNKLMPLQTEFLTSKIGFEYIMREIKKQNWSCDVDITTDGLVVIAKTKNLSEEYSKFVLGCMKSFEIVLDDSMMKCWKEKELTLRNIVNGKDIENWCCFSQNQSHLTALAASSEIGCIQQKVVNFFGEHAVYEKEIVDSYIHGKYLKKFRETELKYKVAEWSENMSFKFTSDGHMIAKGTKIQMEMLQSEVENILSHTELTQYTIEKSGMSNHFQTSAGLAEINAIADNAEAIIEISCESHSFSTVPSISNRIHLEGYFNQNLKLLVIHGDITTQKVDAIVNAANENLQHGAGLAAAIVQVGGQQIQSECTNYIEKTGPLDVSDCYVSQAGNLPCKKVIHAVGPVWKGGNRNEPRKLFDAVAGCINAAKIENLSTIAFPAISTKIFQYPIEEAIPVIIDGVLKTCANLPTIREVRFVDTDQSTIALFTQHLSKLPGFKANRNLPQAECFHSTAETAFIPELEPSNRKCTSPSTGPKYHMARCKGTVGETCWTYNGCTISLLKDDIVNVANKCNVIVNSTSDTNLLGGNESSKAITKAAGTSYSDKVMKKYPNGLQGAMLATTNAGQLGCDFVYHIACPHWNAVTGVNILSDKIEACLNQLSIQQLTSIAFPAIGTGVLDYPANIVAKTLFDVIISWLNKNSNSTLKSVFLVVFPKSTAVVKQFELEFNSRNGNDGEPNLNPLSTSMNSNTVQIGSITIEVINGDIVTQNVDCIVCPTNPQLDLNRGQVAASLKAAGGKAFENALNNCNKSFNKGVLYIGTYNSLPCKGVLFVDAPEKTPDRWTDIFKNAIKRADKLNFVSLAVPVLGAGTLKRNIDDMANMMMKTILTFANSKKNQNLKLIRIVLFQKSAFDQFLRILFEKTAPNQSSGPNDGLRTERAIQMTDDETITKPEKEGNLLIKTFYWAIKGISSAFGYKNVAVKEESLNEQKLHLLICGTKASIQKARISLDKSCDEKCPEKFVSRDIIADFDQNMIDTICSQAEKRDVEVRFVPEQNKIIIRGYRAVEFQEYLNYLLDMIKEEMAVVQVKWYMRKDTSSPWDLITFGLSRLEKKYQILGGRGSTDFDLENDGVVCVDFNKMIIKSPRNTFLYHLKRLDRSVLPLEWDLNEKCLVDYKLVKLDPKSIEYSNISNAVLQTAKVTIERIERVENPVKYQQYMALKVKIEKSMGGVQGCIVAEKFLFHGTDAKNVPGICIDGFDRSLRGQNVGTMYGGGSYFARDFSYSADPKYGPTTVFYVRVLTGNFIQGTPDMVTAPMLDAINHVKYDSVVDTMNNPSIFVVFSDNHAYPAYVITYKNIPRT